MQLVILTGSETVGKHTMHGHAANEAFKDCCLQVCISRSEITVELS